MNRMLRITFTGFVFSTSDWIVVQWQSQSAKCAADPGFTMCGLLRTWRTGACGQHNLCNILKVDFHHVATWSSCSRLVSSSSCFDLKAINVLQDCLKNVTRYLATPEKVKVVLIIIAAGVASKGLGDEVKDIGFWKQTINFLWFHDMPL